jgi:hypothetical protein
MSCHAMHPIQNLFLEGFSYVLQIDMHFICTPMWKKNILVKSGCYTTAPAKLRHLLCTQLNSQIKLEQVKFSKI